MILSVLIVHTHKSRTHSKANDIKIPEDYLNGRQRLLVHREDGIIFLIKLKKHTFAPSIIISPIL